MPQDSRNKFEEINHQIWIDLTTLGGHIFEASIILSRLSRNYEEFNGLAKDPFKLPASSTSPDVQPVPDVPPFSKILTLEAGGKTTDLGGWLQYFGTVERKFASPKDLLSERVLADAGAINLIRHNIGEGPILFPLSLDYSNDKVDVIEHIVKSFPGVVPPKTEYGVYAPRTNGWNTLINFCQEREEDGLSLKSGTSLVEAIFGMDVSISNSPLEKLFGIPLASIYIRTPDNREGKDKRRTLEIRLNPEDNQLHINCGAIPLKTYGVAFGIIPEALASAVITPAAASGTKPAQP